VFSENLQPTFQILDEPSRRERIVSGNVGANVTEILPGLSRKVEARHSIYFDG
jgi:hypothetical protein